LCRKRRLAEQLLVWLGEQKGIKQARVNYSCASVVIEYDVVYEGVLRATVGRLALIGLEELERLVDPQRASATEPSPATMAAPTTSRPAWSRVPLVLPTASLLMAFSLNPVVSTINFP
jgi:Cu2+-exporting ATPase